MASRSQLAARRKALGHSQASLARLLDVRPQSVARWEQGTSTPLARFRRPLADVLNLSLPELEHLIDHTSAVPNGHAVPHWLDHYTSLEQGAGRLQTFEPIAIPGLLQTRDYATAVMWATHRPVTEEVVAELVQARMSRQAVLDRAPEPLELVCVIDESVLHRVTGTRHVMAVQLAHIATMVARPSVNLQIVPAQSPGLHCAAFGSFRLFTSAGASSPFMSCTEDLTGFNYLDRRSAIDTHVQLFDHLTTVALSPTASIDLLQTTAESYQ